MGARGMLCQIRISSLSFFLRYTLFKAPDCRCTSQFLCWKEVICLWECCRNTVLVLNLGGPTHLQIQSAHEHAPLCYSSSLTSCSSVVWSPGGSKGFRPGPKTATENHCVPTSQSAERLTIPNGPPHSQGAPKGPKIGVTKREQTENHEKQFNAIDWSSMVHVMMKQSSECLDNFYFYSAVICLRHHFLGGSIRDNGIAGAKAMELHNLAFYNICT